VVPVADPTSGRTRRMCGRTIGSTARCCGSMTAPTTPTSGGHSNTLAWSSTRSRQSNRRSSHYE